MTSPELIAAKSRADAVMNTARMRGWELPEEWITADAIVKEARRVATEPEPIRPLPNTADAVLSWCTELAAARADWTARVAVARQVADAAQRSALGAALDYAPHAANRLADEVNSDLVPVFTKLLDTAPQTITGHESAKQLSAHAELLRTSQALTAAAAARIELAVAADEYSTLGQGAEGVLFLFVDVEPHATVAQVAQAVDMLSRANVPNSLDGWQTLAGLGLSFARVGDATRRLEHFVSLRQRGGRTPDGGMLDRSVAELGALAAS